MTERLTYGENAFPNRPDYQINGLALPAFKHRAIEEIDEILNSRKQANEERVWYVYDDDLAIRSLTLRHFFTAEVEPVVLEEAEMLDIELEPTYTVFTEALVSSQAHRSAQEAEVMDVYLSQQVANDPYKFLSHYTFIEFRSGWIDASITRGAVFKRGLVEEYDMTPYDYGEFRATLKVIDALRRGVYTGDSESESVEAE